MTFPTFDVVFFKHFCLGRSAATARRPFQFLLIYISLHHGNRLADQEEVHPRDDEGGHGEAA